MMRSIYYFCTYFDSNYSLKGLALYRSLVRYASPFRLWILCFDDLAYETLQRLNLPQVALIRLRDFEGGDKGILQAKQNRSQIEYYFTCTPSLPLYIFKNYPEVDAITYLDADLFFFSNPSPIYQELDAGSILIVGHRFPPPLKHLEARGIYNVGLLSFRRDDTALQCLHWWRARCLEWCSDRVEDGRYADQKYLDDWPARFPGVVVLQHKGANLAPWNLENCSLHLENGQVLVDSQPLVFFHFHGLRKIGRWLYESGLSGYGVRAGSLLKRRVYRPYIQELCEAESQLAEFAAAPRFYWGSIRGEGSEESVSEGVFRAAARRAKHQLAIPKRVSRGDLWLVIGGRMV